MLIWSRNCFLVADTAPNQESTFAITDTKLYVSVATLSTLVESGFKSTNNWNKYQSKITEPAQSRHSDFLTDPSFRGVNSLFVLSFEDKIVREYYKRYFLPTVEIKDCSVMIDRRNCSDQLAKNDLRKYNNIQKIATGQGDDYSNGCLLDYPYFEEHYKLIAINLSKQQKLDADPKAIQQIILLVI